MKISFSLYSRNSIFSVFNLTINMIMIRLTLYHQWVLHLLLHVTALCQRKKNTFWAEDLKLDQAIFRLNKKNEFGYVALFSARFQLKYDFSIASFSHWWRSSIDERNSSKKKNIRFFSEIVLIAKLSTADNSFKQNLNGN